MNCLLKNATVYESGSFVEKDLLIKDGSIVAFEKDDTHIYDCKGLNIFPGFTDVHVHFREPGFSYKETIETGALAAAAGGFTTVCAMPNLSPVPDCREHLSQELEIIGRTACVSVLPYGAITRGEQGAELSAMSEMADAVCGFSDDGRGVQSSMIMKAAMTEAKRLGKIIAAHCEDNGAAEAESEYMQLSRDLELVAETGCKYHACHISTKQSVELIREAKKRGLDVSCETAPHYLCLDESDIRDDGRFKMNPPLRKKADRQALIEGVADGTVDMIATDHAPHSAAEKSRGYEKSLNGIVGLEVSFPILYTRLVKGGIITLERLIELMSVCPKRRFGIIEQKANLCVFNLTDEFIIESKNFLSAGKSTPFENAKVFGRCEATVCNGEFVYKRRADNA